MIIRSTLIFNDEKWFQKNLKRNYVSVLDSNDKYFTLITVEDAKQNIAHYGSVFPCTFVYGKAVTAESPCELLEALHLCLGIPEPKVYWWHKIFKRNHRHDNN